MEIIHGDGHTCIIRSAHNEVGLITGFWGRAVLPCHSVSSPKVPWASTGVLDNPGPPQCYNPTTFFKERFQTLPSNGEVAIKAPRDPRGS